MGYIEPFQGVSCHRKGDFVKKIEREYLAIFFPDPERTTHSRYCCFDRTPVANTRWGTTTTYRPVTYKFDSYTAELLRLKRDKSFRTRVVDVQGFSAWKVIMFNI